MMTKLFFLNLILITCLSGISTLCAAELNDQEWKELKQRVLKRKRLIIYNNDGADAIYFPRKLKPSKENFIKQRLIHALGSKIDTVAYAPGSSGFFTVTTPTNVGTRSYSTKYPSNLPANHPYRRTKRPIVKDLHDQKTDPLKIAEEFCRKHKLEFFVSLRCNDTHDTSHRPNKPHSRFSQFKRDHPEYLLGTYEKRPPYCAWSAVDFTHQGVRNHFLAMIRELLTNYKVDGIELDFCRHLQYFKSVAYGGSASKKEIDMMTDCMKKIRKMAETIGRKRKRPILIAARLPDSADYAKELGLDVATWMQEKLIDIYIGGTYFRLNSWAKSVKLAHKYGVNFYPSMDESRMKNCRLDFRRNTLTTDRARQAAALRAGADGVYYFNREGSSALKKMMRGTLDDIKLDDKRYFISYRYRSPQAYLKNGDRYIHKSELSFYTPAQIIAGKPLKLQIEMGDDLTLPEVKAAKPVLTAYIETNSNNAGLLTMKFNGKKLHCNGNTGKISMFAVPVEIVKPGINDIDIGTIAVGEGKEIVIMSGKTLLKGKNQAPWRRVFKVHSANSEKIVDGAYKITNSGVKSYQIANLVYPIASLPDNRLRIKLQVQVEKSNTPLAVAFRMANGKNVEIVTLQPNKIGLHFIGKSIAFNTTDKFHTYDAIINKGRFVLNVDGKQLFNEKLVMRANNPVGRLKKNIFNIRNLHLQSFIFGSLAEKGMGIAYWKNIRLVNKGAYVKDFKMELKFSKEEYLEKYAGINPQWEFDFNVNKGVIPTHKKLKNKYRKTNIKVIGKVDKLLLLDHTQGTQGFYLREDVFKSKSSGIILAEWQIKHLTAADKKSSFLFSLKMTNSQKERVYCMVALFGNKIRTIRSEFPLPKDISNCMVKFRLVMDINRKRAILWMNGKKIGAIPVRIRSKVKPGIMFGDGSKLVEGKVVLKEMKITSIGSKR
jgi:hypothetical protein